MTALGEPVAEDLDANLHRHTNGELLFLLDACYDGLPVGLFLRRTHGRNARLRGKP
jgi:hypothetical protein